MEPTQPLNDPAEELTAMAITTMVHGDAARNFDTILAFVKEQPDDEQFVTLMSAVGELAAIASDLCGRLVSSERPGLDDAERIEATRGFAADLVRRQRHLD